MRWQIRCRARPTARSADPRLPGVQGLVEFKCPGNPLFRHDTSYISDKSMYTTMLQVWLQLEVLKDIKFVDIVYYKRETTGIVPGTTVHSLYPFRLVRNNEIHAKLKDVIEPQIQLYVWALGLRLLINKVDNGQGTWEALSANTWFQGTRERDGRTAFTLKVDKVRLDSKKLRAILDEWYVASMQRLCLRRTIRPVDPDNPLDAATEKDYHHWYSEAELGDDDDPVEFWGGVAKR